jgi:hypothetical protein
VGNKYAEGDIPEWLEPEHTGDDTGRKAYEITE